MSASATKSEFTIFLARMGKWEKTKHGAHSNLRDSSKTTQRHIARIVSHLSEVETLIVLEAFRECTVCEDDKKADELNKLGEGDGISPRRRRFTRFMDRLTGHKSDVQHAAFYALLAPVWNALNGNNGSVGYCMGQAIYKIRDETRSMSIAPLFEGERAEEFKASLIGIMMYNDSRNGGGMDWDDASWFGANWNFIAPVWQILKRDQIFDPARVMLMIEHTRNGTPSSIIDGAL